MKDRLQRLGRLARQLAQLREASEGKLILLKAKQAGLVQKRAEVAAAMERLAAFDGAILASVMRQTARIDLEIGGLGSDIAAQRKHILDIQVRIKGVSRLAGKERNLQQRLLQRRELSELASGASLRQALEV
ncbi:hypothetical protein [Aestuariivirga sp.]|uniref:hypothetical protein n=1 Tax=Aestuariivirga sp. TaxID=2650926 RepID=UPI0039E5653D